MSLQNESLLYHRYRILAELGRGGMGAVYRAHDENLGVEVAIKENLFVSSEFALQFRQEATLLASLRHPSLPRVTDHFVIPDQGQYLVMDFVAGEDARQRLLRHNGPLPEADVLRWARDILDALIYLHGRQQAVIHRDIKPGNVKITPEGRAVLVDFGLAKVHDDTQATAAGAKALSPGYSPPEQYGAGRTDPRSDLYAVGATLYALLAAQPPPDSLERALGQKPLIPLYDLNPGVSVETAAAIEKALTLKPDGRFQTAAAFLGFLVNDDRTAPWPSAQAPAAPPPTAPNALPPAALSQPVRPVSTPLPVAAPSAPISTPPETPVSLPAAAPSRRGPPWGLIAGLGLVGVLALAAAGLWAAGVFNRPAATPTAVLATLTLTGVPAADTATAAPAPTETDTAAATEAPVLVPTVTGPPAASDTPAPSDTPQPSETFTPAPTVVGGGTAGLSLAFVSERSGRPQIYLMDAEGGNITPVTNVAEGACQPAWSPDGQALLFVTPCTGKKEQYSGSAIYYIKPDGTGLRPFITLLGGEWDPAWSVTGVAFTFNDNGRAQVYLADDQGANPRRLSGERSGDSQPTWSGDGERLAFRNNSRSGQPTIYWMFKDGTFADGGTNPEAVTRDVEAGYPAWSPDGQYVTYMVGSDIWLAEWDQRGFGAQQLTTAGPNADPAWSPDSQWLVFESWRDAAQHDLYRMSFTGAQVTRLTNDAALDYQPAWRP